MLDVVEQLVCQRVFAVRRVVVVMVTQLLALLLDSFSHPQQQQH